MAYRVLIVDEDAAIAIGVREILLDAGHEVVGIAKNGEEAVDLAMQTQPDVAVVDIELPGIDGIETTRRLVTHSDIVVLILTACAEPEFVEGAVSAGAFAYLMKPVTKDVLCSNLRVAAARAAELSLLRKEVDDALAAMEIRKLSERAKYVLMARLQLSEAEAFSHLRQKCRNQNKTMRQVSEEILAADREFLAEIDKEPPKKLAR